MAKVEKKKITEDAFDRKLRAWTVAVPILVSIFASVTTLCVTYLSVNLQAKTQQTQEPNDEWAPEKQQGIKTVSRFATSDEEVSEIDCAGEQTVALLFTDRAGKPQFEIMSGVLKDVAQISPRKIKLEWIKDGFAREKLFEGLLQKIVIISPQREAAEAREEAIRLQIVSLGSHQSPGAAQPLNGELDSTLAGDGKFPGLSWRLLSLLVFIIASLGLCADFAFRKVIIRFLDKKYSIVPNNSAPDRDS